jgi:hypothetical protein
MRIGTLVSRWRRFLARSLGIGVMVLTAGPRLKAQSTAVDVTRFGVTTGRPTIPHIEPVVAVDPAHPGRIAVAAMAIEELHEDRFNDSWRVVVLVSTDSGANWTSRSLPPTPSGPAIGDPSLVWTTDGTLYLTALVLHADRNLHTWLWSSRDEGRSWTTERIPAAAAGSEDHPVLTAAAPGPSPALTVFATIALTGISSSARGPGGVTFSPVALYSPNQENNNLGWGLSLLDGELLFTYYSMSRKMPSSLWAVRSRDGGRTWVSTRITDRQVPVGFPMLAEDRSAGLLTGRVYAVWIADEESGNVMLGHSDDGGVSWSRPVIVNHDRALVLRARPAVHVSRQGVVAVSWTDGRDDVKGRGAWCWDVYASVSLDGGETFQPDIRLTGAVTCSQLPGNGRAGQRWRWGGDYAGIGSDSMGRFLVGWSDSRSGVFQPYLARITVRSTGAGRPH